MKKIVLPGILAAIVMTVVGMGIGFAYNAIFPSLVDEYANIAIYRAMEDPLMQLFFAYPLILGLILAWIWNKTKGLFKGNMWKKGLIFGLCYFFVATIPGMFITYSSFQVSLLIVSSWTLNGLTNGILSGWIFAKLNK